MPELKFKIGDLVISKVAAAEFDADGWLATLLKARELAGARQGDPPATAPEGE